MYEFYLTDVVSEVKEMESKDPEHDLIQIIARSSIDEVGILLHLLPQKIGIFKIF